MTGIDVIGLQMNCIWDDAVAPFEVGSLLLCGGDERMMDAVAAAVATATDELMAFFAGKFCRSGNGMFPVKQLNASASGCGGFCK